MAFDDSHQQHHLALGPATPLLARPQGAEEVGFNTDESGVVGSQTSMVLFHCSSFFVILP